MFQSQLVFCEATQCSLQIKAPQLSWLWIIAFFIIVTNCSIIFELRKKMKTNKFSQVTLWCIWPRPRNTAETQKNRYYRLYRHQTQYSYSLSHPEAIVSAIVSVLCFEAENPSTTDNSLSFHQPWVGRLAALVVQNETPSFQRVSLLVSQHFQSKSYRPHLR